jgi:hypothetical protein
MIAFPHRIFIAENCFAFVSESAIDLGSFKAVAALPFRREKEKC